MRLKLLTINLHCFAEENISNKQTIIVNEILHYQPDIIFLQEVAQTNASNIVMDNIKEDNYGYVLQQMLEVLNMNYFYRYEPFKIGYSIFDEGLGVLSKHPLENKISDYISKTKDYQNWKTRKILSFDINYRNNRIRVATTHFGWSDGYEVFEDQFKLSSKIINTDDLVILAGDFNIEYNSSEYEYILNLGWHDVFESNNEYVNAITFSEDSVSGIKESRIDFIMTNKNVKLINQAIVFTTNRVSDHFGVYAEIEI